MMSYVSSAPPVKTRLAKPKTHDNTSQSSSRLSRSFSSSSKSRQPPPPDVNSEQCTSYFDVKSRPDAPKNLKQQFKQSFPEATRKLSLDSFRRSSTDSTSTADTMGVRDRYPKAISTAGASSAASVKSASSTLNSPNTLARQLSVVHEAPAVDIASAIKLLQELKKTASPEELVALHRALLPAKESEVVVDPTSQADSQYAPRSSRRNSKLPPGLNTRGEPGDDLLRKLGDDVNRPRPKVQHADSEYTQSSGNRSSFMGETPPSSIGEDESDNVGRSETPTEQEYLQTGVYRTGTLRITNGAASPEPGNMLRQALDNDQQQESDVPPMDTQPDTPVSPDFHPGRPVVPSTESFPGAFRVLHRQQRKTSRPLPPPPEPESRRSPDEFETYNPEPQQHFGEFAQPDEPTQTPHNAVSSLANDSPVILSQPPQPRQRSSYDDSTGPRFQYAEASGDNSPYENKGTVAQFATRLSTVYGEDMSDEEVPGTPNDALAKLTGAPRVRGPRELRSVKSLRSLRNQRPASMTHADSGYVSSDTSSQRQVPSPKPAESTPKAHNMIPRSEIAQNQRDENADNDGESLYTFSQFLSSPRIASDAPPESPSSPLDPSHKRNSSKKDLPSLLKLRDKVPIKRMSLPAGELSTNESLTSLASTNGSEKNGKVAKKLRKPMPEHLKRERSHRVSPASEICVNECPLVSTEMDKSLEERYFQPPAADKEIDRRASASSLPQSFWNDGSRESEQNVKIHDDDVNDNRVRRKNPFHRKRSVSRGRKSNVRGQEPTEQQPSAEKSGRTGFLRSLSRSRSARRASIDSADCNTPTPRDPYPSRSAAGASPADSPRAQANGDPPRAKGTEPWRTGPAPKPKSKSMGMTEEMASELARSKSRDVGGQVRAASTDRPRMATPKSSDARGHARSPSVGPPKSGRMVEDFVPGWHSKPSSPAPTPPRADNTPRPYSMYADSIPPMPEIPVEVAAKAAMANKLMSKKKKDVSRASMDTPRQSPNRSQQNSAASSPKIGRVKRAVMEREEQEKRLEERLAKDQELETLPPTNRTAPKPDLHVAVRELQGSSSEQSSILEDSRPSTADRAEIGVARSPSLRQEEIQPNKENQAANLWAERRKSLGTYLPNSSYAFSEDGSEVSEAPRIASPEIVVSRYITPIGNDIAARAHATPDPTGEAARHADLYRSLLDEEEYCPPGFDIPRSDSAYSSASSNGTVPNYQDLPTSLVSRAPQPTQRNVSGVTTTSSVYSNQYSALPRTRSPGGRVRTPSGKFYAYEPNTHASQAERSRVSSLGKLRPTGPADSNASNNNSTLSPASSTDGLSTIFSDTITISSCGGTIRAKPKDPNRRHNFPDPKEGRQRSKSRPERPRLHSRNSSNLTDRYSGGLAWEWDRDSGFGGSAGTRLNGEAGTRRKGQELASSYGVDLGDVPIFLSHSPDQMAPPVQQQKKGYFGAR